MRINLPPRRRLAQQIKAAVADRQMIHLTRSAGAWPNNGQFAVTPECAVEQNNVGRVNCIPQFLGYLADTRREQRGCS